MDLDQVKRIASDVMGVGVTRVRIVDAKKSQEAITKGDVRGLIASGAIEKRPVVGISRVRAKKIAIQKKKGRRRGAGNRRGAWNARTPPKEAWMARVRALREHLNEIKPTLNAQAYRQLYLMTKGGYFRSKGHMDLYIAEKKLKK